MDVSLFVTPDRFSEAQAKGKRVVVIDVLRASSTIVQAYENGVARIIPVAEVEDATRLVSTMERKNTILGGEREGNKIDGFDLGNSPAEYSRKTVQGKTLIMATTNGTVAMAKSASASEIVVGCFLNLAAVVRHVISSRAKQVSVLCAGKLGQLSLEDLVCGGLMVDLLMRQSRGSIKLNDGAAAARALASCLTDVGEVLRTSSHGVYLAELGFEEDLVFCAEVDKYSSVPAVVDGRISGRDSSRT